jgi:hypothetical protein
VWCLDGRLEGASPSQESVSCGGVAKLAAAPDLGSGVFGHGDSTSSAPTKFCGYGEIGRHEWLKPICFGVQVQVLLSAPSFTVSWPSALRRLSGKQEYGNVSWVGIPHSPPVLEARAMVLTALEKQHMVMSHESVRFTPLPPRWRVPLTAQQTVLKTVAPSG